MTAPVLELDQVRCSVDETTLLDNVSLRTSSRRVGLSGKTAGVAALFEGRARLLAGQVKVLGEDLPIARGKGLFGCAVRVTQVPPKWTVRQILELAAQVAGYSRADSRARAKAVLERVGHPGLLKRVWSRCAAIEQSMVELALGLVTDPSLLFVSLPIGEFRLPEILRYGPALARAIEGLDVIAELRIPAKLPEELTWVAGLDSMTTVFESGPSISQGALGRNQVRYLLRAQGDESRASSALRGAGFSMISISAPAGQLTYLVDIEVPIEGAVDTGPLLDIVIASGLDILELTPVASVPPGK